MNKLCCLFDLQMSCYMLLLYCILLSVFLLQALLLPDWPVGIVTLRFPAFLAFSAAIARNRTSF